MVKRIQCRVVNYRSEDCDVYIGRPSKWGNPYSHSGFKGTIKTKTRKEAIENYREWITRGEGRHLLDHLHELEGKRLGCVCKPKPCHGDVLVELVDTYRSKLNF